MGYKLKNEYKYAQGKGTLNNQIKYQEKNRPKYEEYIPQELLENKSIAEREAYAEPREVVAARTDLEQQTSDAVSEAMNVSDSASSILNTLSAINSNKSKSYLDLGQMKAAIKSQRLGDLYRQNYVLGQAKGDEQKTAFEYNVAAPYADKLTSMREKKAQRTENIFRAVDSVAGLVGSAVGANKFN